MLNSKLVLKKLLDFFKKNFQSGEIPPNLVTLIPGLDMVIFVFSTKLKFRMLMTSYSYVVNAITRNYLLNSKFQLFLKKWASPGLFFVYFRSFLVTISIIQIEKSIDCVLGIWTRGRRMVGADKTKELWRPPSSSFFRWLFFHPSIEPDQFCHCLVYNVSLPRIFPHKISNFENVEPFLLRNFMS